MDLTTAFWYVVGLFVLLLLLQLLAKPLEITLKLAGSSLAGGIALWGMNLAGGVVGFHLALNPVSAAIAGTLGIPGVVSLGLMRLILG
jgi:inhibitor of the pro-sigma K processing machinery